MLIVCTRCRRHVRHSESKCPFCGSVVSEKSPQSLGLAVAFSLAAAIGCAGETDDNSGAGGAYVALYGPPPIVGGSTSAGGTTAKMATTKAALGGQSGILGAYGAPPIGGRGNIAPAYMAPPIGGRANQDSTVKELGGSGGSTSSSSPIAGGTSSVSSSSGRGGMSIMPAYGVSVLPSQPTPSHEESKK